ncbi:hypothetical protein Tco_1109367 [Tanacetum coccineum]
MNQNYYDNSSGFDHFQTPQYAVDYLKIQEPFLNKQSEVFENMLSVLEELREPAVDKKEYMSIEEIEHEKLRIDDEIKDITNGLGIRRFRGEKIDDEYERRCEIQIEQLLQDYAGLDIEMRKKERVLMEEKSLAISQRIKSICDDDEDDFIPLRDIIARYSSSVAITSSPPDLPTVEPEDSLNMGDEHLSTIPETESDEVIKSSVENLVPIPKKLLNVYRLIAKIKSLNDNPTPDRVLNSPSSFPIPVADSDWFFEESDTSFSHSGNSLPEFESFSDHTEETRSGSTTSHANYSLLEYDSFLFGIEPDQGWLTSVVISDNSIDPLLELPQFESFHFDLYDDSSFPRPPPKPPDVEISLNFEPDAPVINNFDELNEEECFYQKGGEIFIRTFLPYLTCPEDSPLLLSTGSEDTIFDLGIIAFHLSLKPAAFEDSMEV